MVILSDSESLSPTLSSSSGQPYGGDSSGQQPKPRAVRTLAPNLTRRSHKKSRGGCFHCKSRKIKCQENRPQCENCLQKDLDCQYPAANQSLKRGAVNNASSELVLRKPSIAQPLQSAAESFNFSLKDFRFFHHFLTIAHPHLPLGNDDVWIQQIPIFAQQNPYLMSALLALGASHLTRINRDTDFSTEAFVHRGNAIKGLNAAMTRTNRAFGESDAMLATCYALTFQTFHMGGDSLFEFVTMVRGCALVTGEVQRDGSETAFNLEKDFHYRIMSPELYSLPPIRPAIIESGVDALVGIQLVMKNALQHQFHNALLRVLLGLQKSSRDGYLAFMVLYSALYNVSHGDFIILFDPSCPTIQLLMVYFVSIQLVMSPLTKYEFLERKVLIRAETLHGMLEWAESLFDKIPPALQIHLCWPQHIIAIVRAELSRAEVPDEQRVIMIGGA